MDPESKKLLEETHRLAQENNQMLHSVHRSMRVQRVMSFLYWAFIIGSAVGAYYLIQPYIDAISGGVGGAKSGFSDILNQYKQLGQ